MTQEEVLKEIEGIAKKQSLPIIGPIKGKVLETAVKKYKPKRILEIGTLVGYSSILMSRFLPEGGIITTIEINPGTAEVARENFKKCSIENLINSKVGDAKTVIPTLKEIFDLLFLDAEKKDYLRYLKSLEDKISPDAVVIADNVKIFASQMKDYLDYVRKSGKYESKTYDLGFDAVEVSIRNR